MRMENELPMTKHDCHVLNVKTATGEHKVFLQGGFYMTASGTSCIHEHNYAEIHLIAGGSARFTVEDKTLTIDSGDMLIVPKKTFHSCDLMEDSARHCAFQIDCDIDSVKRYELSDEIIIDLFRKIESTSADDDHSAISAHIALLCTSFEQNIKVLPQTITDYGFLIFEFFSKNYNSDIRLSDLAELLHVSSRQAQRLVLEYTGRSFRDELSATRVRIARQLLKTTDMSLAQITEYTGYHSYAGFWKAMKKFEDV